MKRVPRSCVVGTPADLATSMVNALGVSPTAKWLEPCVGAGALLRAVSSAGVGRAAVRGLDISNVPEPSDKFARVLRGVDFLSWAQRTDERFDRIIANPPYARIARMPLRVQRAATSTVDPLGEPIPLRANCWYAFVCASLRLLSPHGSMCFVLPAAWDFASYALPLRRKLAAKFGVVEVYRAQENLFAEVRDGRIVLLARGYGEPPGRIRRRRLSDRSALVSALCAPLAAEQEAELAAPRPKAHVPRNDGIRASTTVFGEIFSVDIGIVTGQVDYFLMSDLERRLHKLPVDAMVPVVSRARQLTTASLSREKWLRMRDAGERVWMFSPPPRFDDHAAVAAYKHSGSVEGNCDLSRLKIRAREEWYRPRAATRVDGFVSGMSHFGPWLSICEMPDLRATNTLYVVRARQAEDRVRRYAWAIALLSSKARESGQRRGRRYADGLLKWEPGDIAGVRIPRPPNKPRAREAYGAIIRLLLDGDRRSATLAADSWLKSGKPK